MCRLNSINSVYCLNMRNGWFLLTTKIKEFTISWNCILFLFSSGKMYYKPQMKIIRTNFGIQFIHVAFFLLHAHGTSFALWILTTHRNNVTMKNKMNEKEKRKQSFIWKWGKNKSFYHSIFEIELIGKISMRKVVVVCVLFLKCMRGNCLLDWDEIGVGRVRCV